MNGSIRFPEGFVWGTATSAYQIEGSPLADGAGPGIWHRFSHTPGRTQLGQTGDVACDHYRRWRGDVDLMRALGVGAYRFGVSWGRVLPEGRGRVNPAGLSFYDRLVDALLEAGIAPMATLYHWDLPAALDDRGGWLNPDVARWFADYARVLFEALDDRVRWWVTINEPWVVMDAGYQTGVNAPGHRSPFEAARVAHHLLVAHAEAVRAYRALGRHAIGLVVNLEPKEPASHDPADLAAAGRADAYMNRQFLDPVLLGGYPPEVVAMYGEAWPALDPAEIARLREPMDFLGINWYTRKVVRDDPSVFPTGASAVWDPEALHMTTGWEVHPESLTRTLLRVRERYGNPPILVTENGAAFPDPDEVEGERLEDPLRVAYLRDHVLAVRRAIEAGVDVRGYFVWSLLDNFEWASGYRHRMGLFHVDYRTQRRTWKASAHLYREIVASHGACLGAAPSPR